MTRRVVTTTSEEVLVRWCIDGPGGRPRALTDKRNCLPHLIREKWVPLDKTFTDNGKRYHWMLTGHGEAVRLPVEDDL